MLTEFVSGISRIAALYSLESANAPFSLDEIRRAATMLNVEVHLVGVRAPTDLAPAIASAAAGGAQALYFVGATLFSNNADLVAEEALKRRLPSISDNPAHTRSGGLLSYGANVQSVYRRGAYYVDRILKGAKPADLPVEQPTLFDFVINKKTADALGLTIPERLLVFATEVIE
jgi:putative tryptophan/tyrosine transport system substrate-binding protein